LIKKSKYCVAYTGAGLSKSSGIPDYATKEKNSVAQVAKIKDILDAQPTYAHCVLTAMEKTGMLHYYVQQNHDGLPQKSGFPQSKINEIHGAWFDPSNPVVQFNENLRGDLLDGLIEAEKKADLCLCLGTSLSGMNADRVAETTAKKSKKNDALGTIIITLQRTKLDVSATVRVWAKLDDAFKVLAKLLEFKDDEILKPPVSPPEGDVYQIPYNAEGKKDTSVRMTLDLRPGSKVIIVTKGARNEGAVGEVEKAKKIGGHYTITFHESKKGLKEYVPRALGAWWITDAISGNADTIPVVNENPQVIKV